MKPLENLLNPEDPLPEGERPGMFGTMVMAQEQWMKVRPSQVLYLRRKGMLRAALADAAGRTSDMMVALTEAGAHPWTAIEEAKREHLWLPDEDEAPQLEAWQAPYGQPSPRKTSALRQASPMLS